MRNAVARVVILALIASSPATLAAGSCGWSHVDHRINYDDSGPWNPAVYRNLMFGLEAANLAGAVWQGADTRIGRSMWQVVDAELISSVASEIGKHVFARSRPAQEDDPCAWFQGGSHRSFPSGEAAAAAALVTPYLIEYSREDPWVLALLAIPAYVGVARVKNQAHWQTDVLAGWAIGALSGWYAQQREVPITVELLPDGATIGLRKRF
jgi:membrane-associated phospholipid phosphatase